MLCSLFIGGAMVSCAEDYMETDKGHDTLTLTVNQQEIVLKESQSGGVNAFMDYGNELRKRKPYFLYTGNSQGGNRLRPCLFRRFRNGNLSVDEENGRTQSVSEHAARRRLCRKSIAGSTHYRYCCRNGRKGAACHSCAGCDYLSTGYSDALPHRRSCP
jgi:hypothetical protein